MFFDSLISMRRAASLSADRFLKSALATISATVVSAALCAAVLSPAPALAANDDWISVVTPGKTPVRGGPEVAYQSFRIIYGYWPPYFDNAYVTNSQSGVQGFHWWWDPGQGKWIRIFDGDGKANVDCSGGRGAPVYTVIRRLTRHIARA